LQNGSKQQGDVAFLGDLTIRTYLVIIIVQYFTKRKQVRMKPEKLPHVVIVGAGFGGLETAQKLAHAPIQITLIDRHNYHLFQPLLYQIAIAGLVPSQIAYPLRTIFRKQKHLTFQMGEVKIGRASGREKV